MTIILTYPAAPMVLGGRQARFSGGFRPARGARGSDSPSDNRPTVLFFAEISVTERLSDGGRPR
jgi:hypothetical protein